MLGVKIHVKDYSFDPESKEFKYSDMPIHGRDIVQMIPKLKHIEITNKDSW